MIKEWLDKNLSIGEKYLSVEAIIKSDEQVELNALLLAKKKDGFNIERQLLNTSAAAIYKASGKDFPMILTVSGKQVVVKRLGVLDPLEEIGLQNVFPNAKAEEFLFQTAVIEQQSYITVLRRSVFEDVFTELSNQGFKVVWAFLGPLGLADAHDKFTPQLSTIYSISNQLTFSNGQVSIEANKEEKQGNYFYKDTAVSSEVIVPFAGILAWLTSRGNFGIPDHQGLEEFITDHNYRKRFDQVAKIGTLALLALVVLNRLVSFYYTKSYAELEVLQAFQTGATQESGELTKELEVKKQLAAVVGFNQTQSASFYGDQIGALIPVDISLTELTIFPLMEGNKEKKQEFANDKISVSGETESSPAISQLVKDLSKLDWVQNATIDQINDSEDLLHFTIQIKLR